MLIRLSAHPKKNPNGIDKLIVIRGLPEEMMFSYGKNGERSIRAPFEADVDVNIPKSIRHLCTPVEVTYRFPPIEKGVESVVDKKIVLGLRFDFQNQPGHELWQRIEKILDQEMPRGMKIPEPVIVAEDMRSPFSLEPEDIPVVDLNKEIPAPLIPKEEPKVEHRPSNDYQCECGKAFEKPKALHMHERRSKHGKFAVAGVAV